MEKIRVNNIMPVNDKILFSDYNTYRNAVTNILGVGSGSQGYGQAVQSSTVSGASGTGAVSGGGAGANSIRTDEYSKLRSDIISVYRHIYGVDPTPALPIAGQPIRYVVASGAVSAEYDISEYGIAEYNASSIAGSDDPYTQFQTFITDITNNRFSCAANQSLVTPRGSAVRTASWGTGNATISCRVRVSFTDANAARYFFNSGGEIRISASRSGGATSNQNTSWTNILNSAATQTFSAQFPGTALSGTAGQNWYTLSNTYQTYYTLSGSTPYASNVFRLQARTLDGLVANNNSGTSSGVDILVIFQDNYNDPAVAPHTPATIPPIDVVDGTLTVNVAQKRADGFLQTGAAFTIESPTIAITGTSTSTANTID